MLGTSWQSQKSRVSQSSPPSLIEKKRSSIIAELVDEKTPLQKCKEEAANLETTKEYRLDAIHKLQADNEVAQLQLMSLKKSKVHSLSIIDEEMQQLIKKKQRVMEEYDDAIATWTTSKAQIEAKVEEEKTDFVQLQILFSQKQKVVAREEAKSLALHEPDPEFRAKVKALCSDLSDVELKDIQNRLDLIVDTDLLSLHHSTLRFTLRTLFTSKLHEHPEVEEMWNGKSPAWKAIHGQTPVILCGLANKDVLRLRITTYLKLQRSMDYAHLL